MYTVFEAEIFPLLTDVTSFKPTYTAFPWKYVTMDLLPDSGHARAEMHAGISQSRVSIDSIGEKNVPDIPGHAQRVVLRIWQVPMHIRWIQTKHFHVKQAREQTFSNNTFHKFEVVNSIIPSSCTFGMLSGGYILNTQNEIWQSNWTLPTSTITLYLVHLPSFNLHARPWIPGDEIAIFTAVIH